MIAFYLLAIASAFLQTVNGWIFWPVLVVVAAGLYFQEPQKTYWLAFWTGLVTDLLTGKTLGNSAILLLLLSAVVYFGRRKVLR